MHCVREQTFTHSYMFADQDTLEVSLKGSWMLCTISLLVLMILSKLKFC